MIGQTISHYRITEKLGEGGMGVVYKAEDTKLDRPVALKFLAPHLLRDEEGRKRFQREAKAAAALDHPNICTVHEIDEVDSKTFIVMAFLEGLPLSKRIADGPLKLNEALSIAGQIAEGLEAAHEKGVVHRDIKPDNIMLLKGSRGLVKIMDFGLAQLAGSSKLTRGGSTLGTMSYMSPEQAQGADVDRRTDIWSLGVVLYEMVSGQPPFRGDFDQAVVYSIVNEAPEPLTAVRTGVPKELERIVDKALAKDPNARYQHVDEMLVDLRELKRARESDATRAPAVAPKPPKRTWMTWALAAALGICAVGGFWVLSRMQESEGTAPAYQETPLTSYPGAEREPTFSPDGSQVAFAWNGPNEDNFDIYVQVVGSANPVRITSDPADDRYPSWSPDGRLIAFTRILEGRRALYVVPPLGGQERKVLSETTAFRLYGKPAWFPDGESIAVSVLSDPGEPVRIMQVHVEAGPPRVLVPPVDDTSNAFAGDGYPAISPDGESLAWRRVADGVALVTKKLGDEAIFKVAEAGGPDGNPRDILWSPDGKKLVFVIGPRIQGSSTSRLLQVPVGGGSPEPVRGVSAGANDPAVSHTGNRLAYARVYDDPNLWRVDLAVGGEKPRHKLAPSTRAETVPRISPDGKQVVFVSNRGGEHRQIWVCDSDGSNLRQITSFADRPAGSPRWSPDGRMIVFDSLVERNWQTFIVNTDGGQARQITSGDYFNSRPAWSQDGALLYFYSTREAGDPSIWKVPVEEREAVRVTEAPATDPFESYDGQWLYFLREDRLWKVPAAGGTEEIVSEEIDLSEFAWSSDQHGNIYWVERDDESGQWAVRKLDPQGEVSDVAFMDRPPQGRAGLDVAPDGTWFVYAQDDQSQSDLMLVENFR